MIFLISSGKMAFLFRQNMIFFYGWKMKDDLSQEIYENMMFSVCLVKMVFLFPEFQKWRAIRATVGGMSGVLPWVAC